MASLLENTSRIANANENIKTSLIAKGAKFLEGEKIDTYSSKIDSLNVIQPGNYNVECYIRIDDVLVGEGITFNVVGTDGTTQTATSRAAGFIYLTLSYGVGYDIQPVDTEKYYANSHELIYHIKEDGNYFATDYYFYTAGTGEDFKIKDLSYQFYQASNFDVIDNLLNVCSNQPTNIRYFAYLSAFNMYEKTYKFIEYIKKTDFSKVTSCQYAFHDFVLPKHTDDMIEISLNLDFSSSTNLSYFFDGFNRNPNAGSAAYDAKMQKTRLILNINGTSSKVTNFEGFLRNARAETSRVQLLNINMSKCTSNNALYNCYALEKLTFSGSFGGLSTTTSLTLDLSRCTLLTLEAFLETMQTISANTNGKTRIIKLPSSLYNSLTDEILDLADVKGYTLSS